jgi:hypothetical protein
MDYICQFKGCRNKVVRGQKFCREHIIEEIKRLQDALKSVERPKKNGKK